MYEVSCIELSLCLLVMLSSQKALTYLRLIGMGYQIHIKEAKTKVRFHKKEASRSLLNFVHLCMLYPRRLPLLVRERAQIACMPKEKELAGS